MKNTGIIYDSTEKTPLILPEFAGLLPPLTGEQFALLEYFGLEMREIRAVIERADKQAKRYAAMEHVLRKLYPEAAGGDSADG